MVEGLQSDSKNRMPISWKGSSKTMTSMDSEDLSAVLENRALDSGDLASSMVTERKFIALDHKSVLTQATIRMRTFSMNR